MGDLIDRYIPGMAFGKEWYVISNFFVMLIFFIFFCNCENMFTFALEFGFSILLKCFRLDSGIGLISNPTLFYFRNIVYLCDDFTIPLKHLFARRLSYWPSFFVRSVG